jgi:transcriptional regulator with XRE-family HTH domain
MKTGARIRKIREDLGMKQEELAQEAGITQGCLSKIETGKTEPSFKVVHRMARTLHVALDDLAPDRPLPVVQARLWRA